MIEYSGDPGIGDPGRRAAARDARDIGYHLAQTRKQQGMTEAAAMDWKITARWSVNRQTRWSHPRGSNSQQAVPCSWQTTRGAADRLAGAASSRSALPPRPAGQATAHGPGPSARQLVTARRRVLRRGARFCHAEQFQCHMSRLPGWSPACFVACVNRLARPSVNDEQNPS